MIDEINEDLGMVRLYLNEHNGKLTDPATIGEIQTAVAILTGVVQRFADEVIAVRAPKENKDE